MSDLPTLTVGGDPDIWLDNDPMVPKVIRIDGDLPTVEFKNKVWGPLAVGDRVTLATPAVRPKGGFWPTFDNQLPIPFATATVTDISWSGYTPGSDKPPSPWFVTVTDVEES